MTVLFVFGAFDPSSALISSLLKEEQSKRGAQKTVLALAKEGQAPFKERREMLLYNLSSLEFSSVLEKPYPSLEKALSSFKGEEGEIVVPLRAYDLLKEEEEEKMIRDGLSFRTGEKAIGVILSQKLYSVKKAESYFKPTRYQHALRVSYLAFKIAEQNRLDPYRAFLAGYYHDLTRKGAPHKYLRRAEQEYGKYFNGPIPSWAYHQFTAPYVLKDDFAFTDAEAEEAIRFHTTGSANMTKLDMIIYAADKIEPGRKYSSSGLIQMMEEDCTSGFKAVLKSNVSYLKDSLGPKAVEDLLTQGCIKRYLG